MEMLDSLIKKNSSVGILILEELKMFRRDMKLEVKRLREELTSVLRQESSSSFNPYDCDNNNVDKFHHHHHHRKPESFYPEPDHNESSQHFFDHQQSLNDFKEMPPGGGGDAVPPSSSFNRPLLDNLFGELPPEKSSSQHHPEEERIKITNVMSVKVVDPHPRKNSDPERLLSSPSSHLLRKSIHPKKKWRCEHCSKAFSAHSSLVFHISQVHPDQFKEDDLILSPDKAVASISYEQSSSGGGGSDHSIQVVDDSGVGHDMSNMIIRNSSSSTAAFHHEPMETDKYQRVAQPQQSSSVNNIHMCTFCPSVFSSGLNLQQHMNLIHSKMMEKKGGGNAGGGIKKLNTFKCKYCDHYFADKTLLTTHIVQAHSKDKPYMCQVCGRGFAIKADVTRHMRIHTGEKPFKCKVCGKAFARRDHVKLHMKVHNAKEQFRPVPNGMTDQDISVVSYHQQQSTAATGGGNASKLLSGGGGRSMNPGSKDYNVYRIPMSLQQEASPITDPAKIGLSSATAGEGAIAIGTSSGDPVIRSVRSVAGDQSSALQITEIDADTSVSEQPPSLQSHAEESLHENTIKVSLGSGSSTTAVMSEVIENVVVKNEDGGSPQTQSVAHIETGT